MSTVTFPCAKTILVPDNVLQDKVGDYVTKVAHELMAEIGLSALVPRTARLQRVCYDEYLLTYETTSQYNSKVELLAPDTGEHKALAEDRLAKWDKGAVVASKRTSPAKR